MFSSLRPRSRQALILYAVAAALVLAGGATAAYFGFVKKPGNVSHPNVEFTQPVAAPKHKVVPETFKWPIYGYTPDRNRYLDANISPPFKRLWVWKAGSLLEFQPILVNGVLYVVPYNGRAGAIDAKTGKTLWRARTGSLSASSPAWDAGRVFIVSLSGRVTCLDAKSRFRGSPLVRTPLRARSRAPSIAGKRSDSSRI